MGSSPTPSAVQNPRSDGILVRRVQSEEAVALRQTSALPTSAQLTTRSLRLVPLPLDLVGDKRYLFVMELSGGGLVDEPSPTTRQPWPQRALWFSEAVIILSLVGLSAISWLLMVSRDGMGSMPPGLAPSLGAAIAPGMSAGMSMAPMGALLFVSLWTVMMVAMMFPSEIPMVVGFWRMSRRRAAGPLAVPIFVAGYILLWGLVGVGAYLAYRLLLAAQSSLSPHTTTLLGAAALIGAGVYQLTKLKSMSLRHCRNPLDLLVHWRPGLKGAARMGLRHASLCIGCCWGLMTALFVLGLMNLAWMGVIASVIFVEKVAPFGRSMSHAVGVCLIVAGATLAAWSLYTAEVYVG